MGEIQKKLESWGNIAINCGCIGIKKAETQEKNKAVIFLNERLQPYLFFKL